PRGQGHCLYPALRPHMAVSPMTGGVSASQTGIVHKRGWRRSMAISPKRTSGPGQFPVCPASAPFSMSVNVIFALDGWSLPAILKRPLHSGFWLRGPGIRIRRNCCRRRRALLVPWSSWFPPAANLVSRHLCWTCIHLGEITMTMFGSGKWVVVGLAVCMLAVQEAKAGIGFQPVSPDELKMTSEPLAPGAPAIILYRQVDRDDNIHSAHEDNYFRIKILTEEGRKHADIEIPFFKGREEVVNVKARTIKPDGSIVNFDGKVFEKELVKGRGLKVLAKTFTLSDVQVGGIIEYFYKVDFEEYYLFESHWILSDELFTKKAQFSLKPSTGTYKSFTLRWAWHALPPGAE